MATRGKQYRYFKRLIEEQLQKSQDIAWETYGKHYNKAITTALQEHAKSIEQLEEQYREPKEMGQRIPKLP